MAAQLKESMQLLDRTWLRKTSNSTFAPKPFKYERAGTVTEGNQGLSEAALHGWERNRRQSCKISFQGMSYGSCGLHLLLTASVSGGF